MVSPSRRRSFLRGYIATSSRRQQDMPRRSHTKTRSGCTTCKARRVRCDEEKPVCKNCVRGDRPCRYPIYLLEIPASGEVSSSDASLFPARDMELIHYWTSRTFTTMTQRKQHLYIWQDYIPQLAFEHRFLLHGMLAVTALHKRFVEVDAGKGEALLDLARYHQQHALVLYIPMLQSINEHNCHALTAFSILLGCICFGLLHDEKLEKVVKYDVVDRFIGTFDALLGAIVVIQKAKEWLHQGELHHLMDTEVPTLHEFSGLQIGLATALENLLACVAKQDISTTTRQGYLNAIYGLATIFSTETCGQDHNTLTHLVVWSINAGGEFVSLMKQREPLALVILAHYGVALTCNQDLWMFQGNIVPRLLDAVYDEMDERWRPYLQWAKTKVEEAETPSSNSSEMITLV